MKKTAKTLIKLAVSLVMITIVLSISDLSMLRRTLLAIPPSTIFTVVILYATGQIISSFKWWLIARAGQISTPYSVALRSYYIGMYVNCFGLGTVGGDVTRGILLANGKPVRTEGVASVIADRAHGLAVIAAIGIVGNLIYYEHGLAQSYRLMIYGLLGLVITSWIWGPSLLLALFPGGSRFRSKIERVAKVFPKDPKTLLLITIISIAFHSLQIWIHAIMAAGVGASIGIALLLSRVPIVNILSTLPFSWQGLGVREAAYLYFLAEVLSKEQAVAFGAMWLFALTTLSAVGGIVSVLSGDLKLRAAGNRQPVSSSIRIISDPVSNG